MSEKIGSIGISLIGMMAIVLAMHSIADLNDFQTKSIGNKTVTYSCLKNETTLAKRN